MIMIIIIILIITIIMSPSLPLIQPQEIWLFVVAVLCSLDSTPYSVDN